MAKDLKHIEAQKRIERLKTADKVKRWEGVY